MLRFIHTSDLHLGKRFGNFSGDLPSRLREARHGVLATLAQRARDHGADIILLAGDTFDTETPAPDVLRQALTEMAHHSALRWVMLPGNHDSLQAAELWTSLSTETPPNLILARDSAPLELSPGVMLMPAPCTTRRPGRDLTDWMDACSTPEGTVRLGLAHGAIRTFSEDMSAEEVIAPDRARRAGLSYLALGDWHGAMEVDPRTWYSGTPEQDRFKHNRSGEALAVTIEGANALPHVEVVPTASFMWRSFDLHVLNDDPTEALAVQLPETRERRHTLARVVASGRSRLAQREALARMVENAAPDFAYLELDDSALGTHYDVTDLDDIDRAGALREAANTLFAQAQDPDESSADRDIAAAALSRLYSYTQKVAA